MRLLPEGGGAGAGARAGVLAYPGGELRHFYGCRSCIRTLGLTEITWAAAGALRVIAADFAPAGV